MHKCFQVKISRPKSCVVTLNLSVTFAYLTSMVCNPAYVDWCRASDAYVLVGSSHQVFESEVIVFKPASIHNGGDDIGCCVIHWTCCIKWFPCRINYIFKTTYYFRTSCHALSPYINAIPLCSSNNWIRWWHSSTILSSAILLPIPKSLRVVRAKRLISFHDSPFANKIPIKH